MEKNGDFQGQHVNLQGGMWLKTVISPLYLWLKMLKTVCFGPSYGGRLFCCFVGFLLIPCLCCNMF